MTVLQSFSFVVVFSTSFETVLLLKKKRKESCSHTWISALPCFVKIHVLLPTVLLHNRDNNKKTNRNNIIELCHSKNTNKYKHHIISIVLLFNNVLIPEASPNSEFRFGEIPTDILRQMGCFATSTNILQLISARWAITCCRPSRKRVWSVAS